MCALLELHAGTELAACVQSCPPGSLAWLAGFDVPGVVEGVYDGALDAEDFHVLPVRAWVIRLLVFVGLVVCGANPVVVLALDDGDPGVVVVARRDIVFADE